MTWGEAVTDEDALLAGIVAVPGDRLRKLVYADYLDERDDPRGELVRLEDRLIDLPPASDEFWELKARRNQLRASSPADWLGAMRYGVEVYPVFAHGWPDDWRGRWRILREFAERWYGVPLPDVGGRRGEIAEEEWRAGQALPESARELVAFLRDMAVVGDEAFSDHGPVIMDMPERMAVSFMEQHICDRAYVVEIKECVSSDDPAVYSHFYREDPFDGSYTRQGDSVSNFAMSLLLDWAPKAHQLEVEVIHSEHGIAQLRQVFPPPVPIGDWTVAEVVGASLACVSTQSDAKGNGVRLRLTDQTPHNLSVVIAYTEPCHTLWGWTLSRNECPCPFCVEWLRRFTTNVT